ncbi:phosphotransferase enzyme family protein [Streptomyces litchfieldiae]|uniref:Phosphotransferase n=1 Tax=Streptomyces litchfieldiae TaxID=3075543 RepID=A0ABU2MVD3_9ACTN|nr:phosphotransferase [Streptomyces sp. DSM 44938]MDT0345059.1 phosphotransferase [Streptomyces sp. DSM 44938]
MSLAIPGCSHISAALETHWRLPGADVTPLMGGMNSATWNVHVGGAHWVAKAVPLGGPEEQFHYGLRLAARVAGAGVASGAPLPTAGGDLTAPVHGHALALLRRVEGRELDGHSAGDSALMGATLGRVHGILGAEPVTAAEAWPPFDLLADADDAALDLRPWLRPAIVAAAARLRRLRPETLSWGPVHGDPAPEHFRLDPATGGCGLIDWGAASRKPRMYDVATAVLDAGGPDRARPLLRAYLDQGVLSAEEVERALRPMLDFRYSINALYYAGRILRGDLTGVADPAGNEERLAEARRWLDRPATPGRP